MAFAAALALAALWAGQAGATCDPSERLGAECATPSAQAPAPAPKPTPRQNLANDEVRPLTAAEIKAAVASPASAAQFVKRFVDRAISVARDASLSNGQRLQVLAGTVQRDFDIETMGRLVLGEYWWSATAAQQVEYQKLFRSFMLVNYADQIDGYGVENMAVTGAEPSKKNVIIVSTMVSRRGESPLQVDWLVHTTDVGHRIIDIVVDGVSMALVQRFQFTSIIKSNGGRVESLLSLLRKKLT